MNFIEEQHKWDCGVIEDDPVWFYYKGSLCRGVVIKLEYGRFKEVLYLVEFRDLGGQRRCGTCGTTLDPEEIDCDEDIWFYDNSVYKQITLAHHELVNPYL